MNERKYGRFVRNSDGPKKDGKRSKETGDTPRSSRRKSTDTASSRKRSTGIFGSRRTTSTSSTENSPLRTKDRKTKAAAIRTKSKERRGRPTKKREATGALKIIPIGGLGEVGKNLTVLEYEDDIIIIDCGIAFPDEEMLGVDVVIPDFSYLIANSSKVRGLIVTHGHEDHIGAIPYLLKHLNIPIYATRLTLGFIEIRMREHGLTGDLNVVAPGDVFDLGCFTIEPIHTTHSVADAVCYSIDTPVGKVFHTGDFKVDYTPTSGEPTDLTRFAAIGQEGVLLLMADSTNAGRKGYTASERSVGITLGNIFRGNKHRIIIVTFSSNVHRVQKIIDTAAENGKKVAISGRSMENMVSIASELGYLKLPKTTMIDIKSANSVPDSELVIITTGSQGEPLSALSRMANNEHKSVKIRKGDVVIMSSTPVPGNEKMVSNLVNLLLEKGADVIYNDIAETHVSGHACQEELKLIHTLIKPKYFVPIHGEYGHLRDHALLAESLGMPEDTIFMMENGNILSVTANEARLEENTVPAGGVMVDGFGVGDVGSSVLRERKQLSSGGLIIATAAFDSVTGEILFGPDIISRGFVYEKDNEVLMNGAREEVKKAIAAVLDSSGYDIQAVKKAVNDALRNYIYRQTKKNPMILPVINQL